MNRNDHGPDDEHDEAEGEECCGGEGAPSLEQAMEFQTASQVLLDMRSQNIELLKLAAEIAGYGSRSSPMKQGELRQALKAIWEVYTEFYSWVDPEEAEEDEQLDEEDDD